MADAPAETANNVAAIGDASGSFNLDFSAALVRINNWIDGGIRLLPNIAVALVVILVFYGIGVLLRRLIMKRARSRSRDNLGDVLGGFIMYLVVGLGILLGATIVIPSLKPGDLVAGLGVSSVAIGFAFKDILQNWLAGLLILLRQPFNIDDQIEVNGFEGTVERIETRATIIRTYDGQRVVVPNSDIYTNAVIVKTAHEQRRSQYDVGIGYADDIGRACDVIRRAVGELAEVSTDPAPEALPWDMAASWVTIRVRWWTHSRRSDVVLVHAQVIRSIKEALQEARIDLPYETSVQLFHDQTEAEDGDRSRQREGWPAPEGSAGTRPRWRAQLEDAAAAGRDGEHQEQR
ncbi:mechanosensitive ion channel family protein [Massilia sp. H6]|uniref:mechanosensitive ion channel family protein n=1 Tax=Massilia sp. H6 TaxID=2970464 RepID=UPI00216A068B|nr:mechanosensitive ion channel family protein [Massilia sp. H6]UVW29296.1 mechanosensitive ion channel family protein [Massilia sp. H6]